MLGHFIKLQEPDDIMTYVDKDWSDGRAYQKAGFVLVDQMQPMEFLVDIETGQRLYPGKNELGIPQFPTEVGSNKYVKVFNSGSYKYIRTLK